MNASTLNLRSGAGTEFSKLTTLSKGQKLVAKGYSHAADGALWYRVTVKVNDASYEGYLLASYVTLTKEMKTEANEPGEALPDRLQQSEYHYSAVVSASTMNLRSGPSTSHTAIAKLSNGQLLYVFGQSIQGGRVWYRVMTEVNGRMTEGYAYGLYVELSVDSGAGIWASSLEANVLRASPSATAAQVKTLSGVSVKLAKGQDIYVIGTMVNAENRYMKVVARCENELVRGYIPAEAICLSAVPAAPPFEPIMIDKDFTAMMRTEGFPESYIPYLSELHREHPNWVFHAYRTGLSWKQAIEGEDKVGMNLVHNDKAIRWLSFKTGAYNWGTDTFVPYDSSYWVTISTAGLQYFMDPRNWLKEESVFMFEELSYDKTHQTQEGVESILKGTPMYKANLSYKDAEGKTRTVLYSQAFLEAAAYSGVSPYHLASRVKQEVVVSATAFSSSCTGKVAGFEGYYNYYNIGAYNSTASMGAVKNGLKFAKYGGTGAALNKSCMIPWNNRYSALVGGGYYIGNSYINRGQNTIYLQKYNVTGRSTYSHQYMSNAEAPKSEAYKVYLAYKAMEDYDDMTITFSIPVFDNMPEKAVPEPALLLNPNGYLKTLSIKTDAENTVSLKPTFLYSTLRYTATVPSTVKSVTISGSPVSKLSSVSEGTGKWTLNPGENTRTLKVKAQNGTETVYTITIKKE